MKNTWKCVLAALAVSAILGGSLVAQTDDGVVVIGKGRGAADPSSSSPASGASRPPGSGSAAGTVQLGSGGADWTDSRDSGVTPASEAVVVEGSPSPPTIEPSGIQYSEPAGGYRGTQGYGEFASSGAVGYAVSDDPRKILYGVGRRSGDIYGLNEGYTNVSAFVPYFTEAGSALWFVQPRLIVTDQGRGAMNLGVGHRAYSHELDRVFAFSTWWDYDAGHEGEYNQIGASFAAIGRNMTFRANGNWVVSQDEHFIGQIPLGSSRLMDGIVVQDVQNLNEIAYNQADVEVSMPMPLLEKYGFEWGAGAYFLFGSDGDDATGAKGRIEAQVTEDLWVNAIISNDQVFDTNVSVNFELTIPNAPPSRWFRRNKVRDSLVASTRRYYRVATDVVSRMDTVAVMMDDGNGGEQMLRLAVIDPNLVNDPDQAFGGTGTENDPFLSIADYMSQDVAVRDDFGIVYVRRRDDASDTNLDTTITLLDRQALLGEGIEHRLINLGVTGLQLPGSSDGLAVPLISNASAMGMNVVTLANANQVSGFTIDAGGTADGIVGVGIDGFAVTDNTIQNAINGVRIQSNTTGTIGTNYGYLQDNLITGIVPTMDNPNNSINGVLIDHTAGDLDLYANWNTVSGILGEDGSDQGTGINVTASGAGTRINARNFDSLTRLTGLTENTLTGNGVGLHLTAENGAEIDAALVSNVVDGNLDPEGAGFIATAETGGTLTLSTVLLNSFSDNAGDGVRLEALTGGQLIIPPFEPLTDLGFNDLNMNGTRELGFIQNTINGNDRAGVRVVSEGVGSLADVSFGAEGVRNTINNNGTDAFVFEANDQGTINLAQMLNTPTQGNQGATIRVTGDGGIIDLGTIRDTIYDRTNVGTAGILFDVDNATITGIIEDNQFLGGVDNANLTFGIGGEVRGGTLDLTIRGNEFEGNADAGIGLVLGESDDRDGPGVPLEGDAVEASIVIVQNVITGTRLGNDDRFDGAGISLVTQGQEQDFLLDQDNGFPPPPGAVNDPTTNVQPAAILEGLIAGNFIGVDPTSPGFNIENSATWDVTQGNAGAGIGIAPTGDTAIMDLAAVGSIIDDPELDGLHIGAFTYQGVDYSGNLIVNNDEGIRVRRSDSAIIDNFNIDGNQIESNRNDGIDILVQNGGLPYGVFDILEFDITNNIIRNNGRLSDLSLGMDGLGISGRGITLRAQDSAVLDIDIANNLIEGNWMGGIEARTSTATHFFFDGAANFPNRSSVVGASGGGDGVIFGVWEQNVIRDNGILVAENADGNGLDDLRTAGHGISLGRIDLVDPDNPGQIIEGFNNGGLLVDDDGDGVRESLASLVIQDNVISGSGRDGIHMYFDKSRAFSNDTDSNRTSRVDVLRNDIVDNGEDGINVHNSFASDLFLTVNDNLITGNGVYSEVFSVTLDGGNVLNVIGDGIEMITAGGSNTFLTAENNRIKENNGRGVNLLTGESGYLAAEWDSNIIASNTREGFYLMNAPVNVTILNRFNTDPYFFFEPENYNTGYGYTGVVTSWHADLDSNNELFNYGRLGPELEAGNTPPAVVAPFLFDFPAFDPTIYSRAPVTDLVFTNNNVNNNGSVVPDAKPGRDPYSTLGGYVMRVGSATMDQSTTPPFVFVPEGVDPFSVPLPDIEPSVPIPGQVGGIRARVEDNLFSGNVVRDFYIDGFVSTPPPPVDIPPDPLARIDLVFLGNRGGSIQVEFDAFYTNTSPTLTDSDYRKSPDDIFGSDEDRPRSITRNLDYGLVESSEDGFDFEWQPIPGLGTRTLRVDLGLGLVPNPGPDEINFGSGPDQNLFNIVYQSGFSFWEILDEDLEPTFFVPPPFPIAP